MSPVNAAFNSRDGGLIYSVLSRQNLLLRTIMKRSAYFDNVPVAQLSRVVSAFSQSALCAFRKYSGCGAVSHIFSVRNPFQVVAAVIELIRVFVINFFTKWLRSVKSFAYQPVYACSPPFFCRHSYLDNKVTIMGLICFQDSIDNSVGTRRYSANPSMAGNFIKSLETPRRFPDFFLHARMISQEVIAEVRT